MVDMDHPSIWQGFGAPLNAQEEEVPSYEPAYGTQAASDWGSGHGEKSNDFMHNGKRPANMGHRPKNVILFGQTGVGKSSVINLLAGEEVAEISSGADGCTLEAEEHSFTFPGPTPFRIFDTVGLEEPEMGINAFLGAIGKAHKLIRSLHDTGGVDLLLFCIRGGRITTATQRNYNLFFDILCGARVPLAIVVTGLEYEDVMEDWWVKNQASFDRYHIRSVTHTCITALPAHVRVHAQKRAESQKALRRMLIDALGNADISYMREKRSWLAAIIKRLRSFLTKNLRFFKKKDLLRKLETECRLPRDDAQVLAQMLTAERDF